MWKFLQEFQKNNFSFLTFDFFQRLIVSLLIVVLGVILTRLLALFFNKVTAKNFSEQSRMIISKIINYSSFFIISMLALGQLGIEITAILGAAGIAGIAIGIASRSSLGNIISGLFLIGEKSFQVGDIIKLGERVGIVHSIDLLSIKLRTFDNLFVRLPNEKIIESELVNITHFPIRRMDIEINLAYSADIEKAQKILQQTALENKLCLTEPEPLFLITELNKEYVKILFGIWFEKSNYLTLRNSFLLAAKANLEKENIDFGRPFLVVSTMSQSENLEKMLNENSSLKEKA